jgi:hypothetical protein
MFENSHPFVARSRRHSWRSRCVNPSPAFQFTRSLSGQQRGRGYFMPE